MKQQWTGIGWVTKKPHFYDYGKTNCTLFYLACNRSYRNNQGNQECDYIPIIAWRNLALSSYYNLRKDQLIVVTGWIKINNYLKEGVSKTKFEIVASHIQCLANHQLDEQDDEYETVDHHDDPFGWESDINILPTFNPYEHQQGPDYY